MKDKVVFIPHRPVSLRGFRLKQLESRTRKEFDDYFDLNLKLLGQEFDKKRLTKIIIQFVLEEEEGKQ
jgi:hypothetical protein